MKTQTEAPLGAILDIDGADRLSIENLRVISTSYATHVRVQNVIGCQIRGGLISGSGSRKVGTYLGTGIEIGEGAHQVSLIGCTCEHVGLPVLISGSVNSPTFIDCDFEQSQGILFKVTAPSVKALTVRSCHFEGKYGTTTHVQVAAGAGVLGAEFINNELGEFLNPDETQPPSRRRVLDIQGTVDGMVVSGCSHVTPSKVNSATGKDAYSDNYIWEISASASVRRTVDIDNYWEMKPMPPPFKTGTNAANLVEVTNPAGSAGALQVAARSARFSISKLGVCSVSPVSRGAVFRATGARSRDLEAAPTEHVLANLLHDLADMGLVRVS